MQYIKFGMSESDVSYLMADELGEGWQAACVLRRAVRERAGISLPKAVPQADAGGGYFPEKGTSRPGWTRI